jgi:monoamine oxidase
MTVTKLKTTERLAPAPRPGSHIAAIYSTVEALGGSATVREIRELLPAAGGRDCKTHKDTHVYLRSIGINLGYLVSDTKFPTGAHSSITEEDYAAVVYSINTFADFERQRLERTARDQKNRIAREVAERKAEAKKQNKLERERERMATARQKLAPVSTTPTTTPATIDPAPETIHEDHSTRMEYAIVAATASVISVGVYALLGQVL